MSFFHSYFQLISFLTTDFTDLQDYWEPRINTNKRLNYILLCEHYTKAGVNSKVNLNYFYYFLKNYGVLEEKKRWSGFLLLTLDKRGVELYLAG